MKKKENHSGLLPEYNFSKAVRGKYAKRFAAGSNIVVLDPDIIKLFPDSDSVNEALRMVVKIAKRSTKKQAA